MDKLARKFWQRKFFYKTFLSFLLLMLIACYKESYSINNVTQLPLPKTLAIYYGFPSLVNGAKGDLNLATKTFAEYDIVVFGDGLEFSDIVASRRPVGAGLTEHENTKKIIQSLKESSNKTLVYGYVDLGNTQSLSLEEIENRSRLWAEMGVAGIFLDEAGYDYGVTRAKQNAAIKIIHNLGLQAFLNAYNLEDIFETKVVPLNKVNGGNPSGESTLIRANDLVLLESFQIRNGEFDDNYLAKMPQIIAYKEKYKVRLLGVTTILPTQAFNQTQYDYAWWSVAIWNLDGVCWGEANYSSSSNLLPKRQISNFPKDGIGDKLLSDVVKKGATYLRKTDLGKIVVDVEKHLGYFKTNKKK